MTLLDYHATSFSAGRMDFQWEELSEADRAQAYADWAAGKGLMGGDPRRRPDADRLPAWGLNQPFFRALALDDARGDNGPRLRAELESTRPLEIEIGFGRGDFLLDRAQRYPERLFLGYEVKTKAARLMLARVARFGLENVWISDDDCRFNLPQLLPDGRVDTVHVLFPDPWWKPQHQVKRLFSPPFVDLLARKLRPGGLLHFRSDVAEYGAYVRYLLRDHLVGDHPAFAETTDSPIGPSVPTHREFWCRRHGRPVHAFYFTRLPNAPETRAAQEQEDQAGARKPEQAAL